MKKPMQYKSLERLLKKIRDDLYKKIVKQLICGS